MSPDMHDQTCRPHRSCHQANAQTTSTADIQAKVTHIGSKELHEFDLGFVNLRA